MHQFFKDRRPHNGLNYPDFVRQEMALKAALTELEQERDACTARLDEVDGKIVVAGSVMRANGTTDFAARTVRVRDDGKVEVLEEGRRTVLDAARVLALAIRSVLEASERFLPFCTGLQPVPAGVAPRRAVLRRWAVGRGTGPAPGLGDGTV